MNTEALAGYAKYDSYQDSGVDWLGDIPEDWELLKVRNIFHLSNKFAEKNNNHELLSVYTDIGVKPRRELEARGNKASTTDGYLIVEKGDIVVNKLLAWMGAIGYSNYDGVTSPAYDILKPILPVSSMFYHFLFRTPRCVSELKRNSRGIMDMRLRLYFDKFGNVLVPYPSLKEQEKIISFLNNETAKIDQAIALKQQQIEKLNEYKQITIQNAVTKGLDANAKMKDSGIDWLGDIPAHWEVKKLKYIFESIQTGTTPATSNESFFGGNINWYSPRDLNKEKLEESERKVSKLAIVHKEAKLFPKDSVLVVGIGATSGKTAYMSVESAFNQQITGLHSEKQINIFYFYLLKSMSTLMLNLAEYTTLPILNNEFFKSLFLVVPPLKEQKEIVEYIEGFDKSISQSVTILKQQIENLKEYKTILINQAVTGKIKVS